jgi:hypothetical protein
MLNPLIYSLRNKDVKCAIKRTGKHMQFLLLNITYNICPSYQF